MTEFFAMFYKADNYFWFPKREYPFSEGSKTDFDICSPAPPPPPLPHRPSPLRIQNVSVPLKRAAKAQIRLAILDNTVDSRYLDLAYLE